MGPWPGRGGPCFLLSDPPSARRPFGAELTGLAVLASLQVSVNQRALIDKVLARYSGENTIFRSVSSAEPTSPMSVAAPPATDVDPPLRPTH